MKQRELIGRAIGFATASVGLVASAWMAVGDEDRDLDRRLGLWIYELRTPFLHDLAVAVSGLGSLPFLAGVAVAVAVFHLRRGEKALAGWTMALPLLAQGANVLLKFTLQLPRPSLAEGVPTSFGYPSGHAMVSTVVYGVVAIGLGSYWPRVRLPVALAAVLLVALIALSRLVLGVHWPSDVIGGASIGGLLLLLGKRPRSVAEMA